MPLSIFEALQQQSWTYTDDYFSQSLALQMKSFAVAKRQEGHFKSAAVGRHEHKNIRKDIRSDQILWIDPKEISGLFEQLAKLKNQLNHHFFLNLNDDEFHFAHYGPGDYYAAHIDQFQEEKGRDPRRVISLILYLNHEWQKSHGGELLIYKDGAATLVDKVIEPVFGRLVLFESDKVVHAVNPSQAERLSFTGWFCRRPVVS
jgi:SM-20-related protein